jgi:hypothetical protein
MLHLLHCLAVFSWPKATPRCSGGVLRHARARTLLLFGGA